MQFVIVLLIAAAVFGVCYLVDKGFSRAFRGKAQHRSGMAVRANKRFGVFGVVLTVLGVMAFCIGIGDGPVLIVGGLIVFAMGVFLAVYYLLRHFLRRGKLPHVPVREEGRCASL